MIARPERNPHDRAVIPSRRRGAFRPDGEPRSGSIRPRLPRPRATRLRCNAWCRELRHLRLAAHTRLGLDGLQSAAPHRQRSRGHRGSRTCPRRRRVLRARRQPARRPALRPDRLAPRNASPVDHRRCHCGVPRVCADRRRHLGLDRSGGLVPRPVSHERRACSRARDLARSGPLRAPRQSVRHRRNHDATRDPRGGASS